MRRIILPLLLVALIGALFALTEDHQYIGESKCKMCHQKQYKAWMETKHAKAFDALKAEDQGKEECLGCHNTGYKKSADLLKNVQCEACHGPGSDYKDMKVMKDKEKAIAAGLIITTEETCKMCHNEKSPTFKGFNFEEAKKTGVHAVKSE